MRSPIVPSSLVGFVLLLASFVAAEETPLRLVQSPALSPDGQTLAFGYGGDLWQVPIDGGRAEVLTRNPGTDSRPHFSPDGETIGFNSNRDGQNAIYQMPAAGGAAKRLTYHSEGYQLQGWFPGGDDVMALGSRDHFWRNSSRLFRISTTKREQEHLLADAYATDASISSDGKRVLLVREGERWWRKGYYGFRSSQIWLLDLETEQFHLVLSENYDCRWPRWVGDENAFVFTRGMSHGFELARFDFDEDELPSKTDGVNPLDGDITQLTDFGAESVVYPAVSRDGSRVVFRHLFDLYSMSLADDAAGKPERIEILPPIDSQADTEIRRTLDRAREVAFTNDGLEIAMISGGDLWVMDTQLREPKRVTDAAGWDESPVFSKDGETLYAIRDVNGVKDIYRIERMDSDLYWWQNEEFQFTQLTNDPAVESDLRLSPTGDRLFYVKGLGDLVHVDLDGEDPVRLTSGFSAPDFDISPDGRWVAYSQSDDDFNQDVFIVDSAGKKDPYNLSRHPDDDTSPRFSSDGKLLAFTGKRIDDEVDIHYVWLQAEERDKSRRQRKLEEALELLNKKRKKDTEKKKGDKTDSPEDDSKQAEDQKSEDEKEDSEKENSEKKEEDDKDEKASEPEVDPVIIDFDRLHERLRRIGISDSYERSLIWSPKEPKLVFNATVDAKRAFYSVTFPDELTPKKFSSASGSPVAWTKESGGLLMLASGSPALLKGDDLETYSFSVPQSVDRREWLQAGFDTAWRVMRDRWYDKRTGGRNWGAVRRKYHDVAATLPGPAALGELIQLMLGELNGSHNGFYPSGAAGFDSPQDWDETTAHLGVRFEPDFNGPGLKVRDVIPGGPADKADSRLYPGDVIETIDGVAVDIAMDLTTVLNGRLARDIKLSVYKADDKEDAAEEEEDKEEEDDGDDEADVPREVVIRPISYGAARSLLYDAWLEFNRGEVERLSKGKLGYLHIQAMSMGSFYEFERQLYAAGYGKDGLVIDVRENGGGSTTDLLLTCLTQPKHAVTVPRGGGPGYPQSRMVFATWNKPIIVLCNQNSYSNAEIFSHAIKGLGRGRLVGVPTAGGVISTGSVSIMDLGRMRMPFRAWFNAVDGVDMEMAGAVPDTIIWPLPSEMPAGNDRQLKTAVKQLMDDVKAWKKEKPPKRVFATERKAPEPGKAPLE